MERNLIYGLLFSCPFDQSLDNCVFTKIRALDKRERLAYIKRLSKEEELQLRIAHQKCFATRQYCSSVKSKKVEKHYQ